MGTSKYSLCPGLFLPALFAACLHIIFAGGEDAPDFVEEMLALIRAGRLGCHPARNLLQYVIVRWTGCTHRL